MQQVQCSLIKRAFEEMLNRMPEANFIWIG
jgi:hypothetical protein